MTDNPSFHDLPRLFQVIRYKDDKKISGVGKVLFGCVFPDGQVVIQWQSKHGSISIFKNLEEFQYVHVKPVFQENEFIWLDGYEPSEEVDIALQRLIEYVNSYKKGRINDKTRGDIIGKAVAIGNGVCKKRAGGLNISALKNIAKNTELNKLAQLKAEYEANLPT